MAKGRKVGKVHISMPYITSIERKSLKRGRQQGPQEGKLLAARDAVRLVLETRFGRLPTPLIKHLSDLNDLARLYQLLRRASAVGSLEEFATSIPWLRPPPARDRG